MKSHVLTFRWGTSRARDTEGYTTCACRVDGKRLGLTSGGGYDLQGAAFADAIERLYPARLAALAEGNYCHSEGRRNLKGDYERIEVEAQDKVNPIGHKRIYGFSCVRNSSGNVATASIDGACGFRAVEEVCAAIGVRVKYVSKDTYIMEDTEPRSYPALVA